MYQNVVIPARCVLPEPESRSLNRSCNPYYKLDSRFTMQPAGGPGMTKRGFTLIELLVVVLIIGILSAVALPQYRRAVIRTEILETKLVLESLIKAEELYYLANGSYTGDLSALDIEVPAKEAGVAGLAGVYYVDNRGGRSRIFMLQGGLPQINLDNWLRGYRVDVNLATGKRTCRVLEGNFPYGAYACQIFMAD